MITHEQLGEYLRIEREMDTVQELNPSVETDINEYLNFLKKAQDECSDYRELSMIRDEYKNAMLLIEGLLDRRFAKLVNYAVISITRDDKASIKVQNADKVVFDSLCEQMKTLKHNMQLASCLVVKI